MEEGLQDGLHQPEVSGQGGRDDEAEQGEHCPVLGQTGGGRGGRAGTFLAETSEELQRTGEDWTRYERESHDNGPDDETSVITLILPDIAGGHILLSHHSEMFISQSDW